MSYDGREISTQEGSIVELYTIVLSGRTYRLTTNEEDFVLGGNAWHATPGLKRSTRMLQKVGESRHLEVSLSRKHPAAIILMSNGIPPRTATVRIQRWHRGESAGELQEIEDGVISHVSVRSAYLVLRVISLVDAALNADLPHAEVSGTCRHMLYGPGCLVDRNYPTYDNHPFMSIATVVSQTGSVLRVTPLVDQFAVARPQGWATFGEVRRLVDGERRSVLLHELGDLMTGNIDLTLDVPFAYLVAGDELEVYKGCDHTITMCHEDFANHARHGGHPSAPDKNPMNTQSEDF